MTVHLKTGAPRSANSVAGEGTAKAAVAAAKAHFAAFATYADSGGQAGGAALEASYDRNVRFHDPLFGAISGRDDLLEMWRLCGAGSKNGQITPGEPEVVGQSKGVATVRVRWTADYQVNGNPVHNEAVTTLKIDRQGRILDQRDEWDLNKWVAQAIPQARSLGDLGAGAVAAGAHAFLSLADGLRKSERFFAHLEGVLEKASPGWGP